MMDPNVLGLAVIFVLVGGLFWGAARALARSAPAAQSAGSAAVLPAAGTVKESTDAILQVEAGGRIRVINDRARALFRLGPGEEPNLDNLARRVRPPEAFLALCAGEGEARFSLEGRSVHGTAMRIQTPEALVIVSLRTTELGAALEPGSTPGSESIQAINELTVAMVSNLELDQTIRSVLESAEKLIPADYLEITLWDSEEQSFTPYRLLGLPILDRVLDMGLHISLTEGFSAYLYREHAPLWIPDVDENVKIRPADGRMSGVRSFLGVPLMVSAELVGTLEFGSRSAEAFHEQDLALARLISVQAAAALRNAAVFRHEQNRNLELNALSQLTQAFSSVGDPDGLFTRLTAIIAPIFQVEILGFLIYNENQHVLEGRPTFHGLPDPFVELYRTAILPGSAAEQTLGDGDVLITENAAEDAQWEVLGLDHLAQAASLRDTALIPLHSGGRMLGYLQASNHIKHATFTQSELQLLTVIAGQASSLIENALLVQQTLQRARRAEVVGQIVSLAGIATARDEVLVFALQELAQLLEVETGALFLLDSSRSVLQLHIPSLVGPLEALPERTRRLLVDDPRYPATVTESRQPFIFSRKDDLQDIIPFYQSIIAAWKIESLIAIPLVVRGAGVGEVWFGSQKTHMFEGVDVQLVAAAAAQLALAVETLDLRTRSDGTLRQRLDRMVEVAQLGRELNHTLDLDNLIAQIHAGALHLSGAVCGSVVFFDLSLPLDEPQRVIRWHGDLHEPGLSDLEQRCVEQAAAQRIERYHSPDSPPPHAGVQSGLVAPILTNQRVAGLIVLHGQQTGQFGPSDQDICESLAVHAGIAYGNALQLEEQTRRSTLLSRELDTLAELLHVSQLLRPSLPLEQSLIAIGSAIRQATPFQVAVISVCDPATMILHRVCATGLSVEQWEDFRRRSQPWASLKDLLVPEFRFGSVYYIPSQKSPALPEDVYTITVVSQREQRQTDSWNQDDFLLLPLYDSNNHPIGLISVDDPSDGRRPDRPTFEALEIFGIQAALMIENYRRTSFLENRASEMEVEVARLQRSGGSAVQKLPMLLRKDLDQTVALQGLNRRIDRIGASLEIASIATAQPDAESILQTLARELLTRFALQTAMIAEQSAAGVRMMEIMGSLPKNANADALFGQRNPLRQLLQESAGKDSEVLLLANLENHPEWLNNPLLSALEARSVIVLQISGGSGQRFGVLLTGRRSLAAFLEDDRRIFIQLARQVGVGLQNLQLLTETQQRLTEVNLLLDYSLRLGSLESGNILAALVESVLAVLPAAQACWAGLLAPGQTALYPQAAAGYHDLAAIRSVAFRLDGEAKLAPALPLQVFGTGAFMRLGDINFAAEYRLTGDDLMNYRKATSGRLPDSCLIFPLRLGETVGGVLMVENFDHSNAFDANDEALVYSFAQQAVLALDNARFYQSAQQRAVQMESLTRVSNRLTSNLKQEDLVASLLDLLASVLPSETSILWLRSDQRLTARAARGFEDSAALIGITVAENESILFSDMIRLGEPVVVADVRVDDRFPKLFEPEHLAWLGLPLLVKGETVGVIAMENKEAGYFTRDQIQVAQTFASQAAVALENARLFEESAARAEELDERSQRLGMLNRLSGELGAVLEVNEILQLTSRQLLDALDAAGTAGVMIGPGRSFILEVEMPAYHDQLPLALFDVPVLDRLRETRGLFVSSDIRAESDLGMLMDAYCLPRGVQSLLIVPLITGTLLHGWLLVDKRVSYRFSLAEIELARTICNQAAIAIQTARLFDETRSLTDFLEKRVEERTGELRREHQNSQTLLRVIAELSTSMDMNMVLSRALDVVNESFGAQESIVVLLHQNQTSYRAGEQLAPLNETGGGDLLERSVARVAARSHQSLVLADVSLDQRFPIPADLVVGYRSVLAVPLMMGEDALGSLLMLHGRADFFKEEQVRLAEATARQLGIAINNAELFSLIRDQSEHLGKMLREQQIESSRSRAILEAVADGVVVTDDGGRVTLFNASAERILGMPGASVIGQPVACFETVFGRYGASWLNTVHRWMEPGAVNPEATFADEFELDSAVVLAVNLAPVLWRSSFLGTVSIFRDITREVQVDRLKSEFVANVSHELRTPMTSIKGYVDLMLMGASGQLSGQQRHFLEIVKGNTDRLGILVNDLLDVSRIEAGSITLELRRLKIKEIIRDVLAEFQRRSLAEEKGMTFELDAPDDLPDVRGDAERIRQVIASLVSNGYNYTPAGGRVVAHVRAVEDAVQVDVEDTGIGIHPGDRERIFERFFRGEDPLVLATAGTGLGLSIARNLVGMHDGQIWFKSSGLKGEGSTFSVKLPIMPIEELG